MLSKSTAASAKPENADLLCNLQYMERYKAHLAGNLPPNLSELTRFFSAPSRLRTLAEILSSRMKGSGKSVLNAGCGPFATELFVPALQDQHIESFDYTSGFLPFYDLFRKDGMIANTNFRIANALTVAYPANSFDLIIIHDVFYETGLPVEVLLDRFRPMLKPGGLLFFDFVNARTERLWRLLGSKQKFQRYDPDAVRKLIAGLGYAILEWRPTYGNSGKAKMVIHKLSEALLRQSNSYAVLIQKHGA